MEILYITTIGNTMNFFSSLIKKLVEDGHNVSIASNENNKQTPVSEYYKELGCTVYNISCSRSPLDKGNIKAIREIREIVSKNKFDIVHCHTPIAAACTRIACRSVRKQNGTKVIYTAHGFHFYSGAPTINWLIYYPIEWLCSFFTDVLVTINTEDYKRAKKSFHAKNIVYVPGVGINTSKFGNSHGDSSVRKEFGIKGFMLLSVGELNENKNHNSVIKAVAGLPCTYVIVGSGNKKDELIRTAKEYGSKVVLSGYRHDVVDFYNAADAYILPSYREGLNVSLMEAMASSLPCLCGRIRGNTDLIDSHGGATFEPGDVAEIRKTIKLLIQMDSNNRKKLGEYNYNRVKEFDSMRINGLIENLYRGLEE